MPASALAPSPGDLADLLAVAKISPDLHEAFATAGGLPHLIALHGSGRPALLNGIKELGVARLAERQALATTVGKLVRGEPLRTQPKIPPLFDSGIASELRNGLRSRQSLSSAGFCSELEKLPSLGASPLLPGESGDSNLRPFAKVRLLALYGAGDTARAFNAWMAGAPSWLEIRPVELPGHGLRASEVFQPGERDASFEHEHSDEELALAITSHRDRLVVGLADELVHLIGCPTANSLSPPPYAIMGFSSGAMLGYLLVLELQRRGAPPPFRLIAVGRGAPHNIHMPPSFWRLMYAAEDAKVMSHLHELLAVPLDAEARPWRGAISCASVHVGTPAVPDAREVPPFPLPKTVDPASTPHASGAALVTACPLVAIGSHRDALWSPGVMGRWADVAGSGFRLEELDGVAHFKLMTHELTLQAVEAELGAAIAAHARFG